jgi:hypothetical protein
MKDVLVINLCVLVIVELTAVCRRLGILGQFQCSRGMVVLDWPADSSFV